MIVLTARPSSLNAFEVGCITSERLNRRRIASGSAVFVCIAAAYLTISSYCCSIRSEEHTSELQSLMRISYAVFCLKKKKTHNDQPEKKILTEYTNIHKQTDTTNTSSTQLHTTTQHTRH